MAELTPFDLNSAEHHSLLAALWNRDLPADLAIAPEFVHSVTRPFTGGVQAGRIAVVDGQPVAAVLASAHPHAPPSMPCDVGWIDAIAVDPAHQRQGIGRELLVWAEEWLSAQGAVTIHTGCGINCLTPGVPESAIAFFTACGYDLCNWTNWDVARNLADYTPPPSLRDVPAAARPAQPGQEEWLLGFLRQEFPGRWTFETEEALRQGGRISDFMLLWTETGVEGVCKLTFEDSAWPLGGYYPYNLPRPWGQLGFIGVAKERRGQGMGLFLLDAGLRRLQNNGVNGCVIDWTDLLDFYGKAGFTPYHKWAVLCKKVG
ncbi:MAG: GNAT family N-acetyltransferase [Caldilineaceae bacterium]